jgi:hypothetical protein
MPSKRKKESQVLTFSTKADHLSFWPFLVLTLLIWVSYRSIFRFPIWFDEIVGKAIFFGLPVWLYLQISRSKKIVDTMAPEKINSGLLLGIAIGGLYGFAGSIMGALNAGGQMQLVPLFLSGQFWWEFFLALMTAFWETLFFYSFVMSVIMEKSKKMSLIWPVLITAGIFLIFHLPNSVLRFSGPALITQIILMFAFGVGQALLFVRWRNFYTLVISHAIWGMALLVHLS